MDDVANLEPLAARLEQSGDYRVLRRVPEVARYADDDPATLSILDVGGFETILRFAFAPSADQAFRSISVGPARPDAATAVVGRPTSATMSGVDLPSAMRL